MGDFSLVTGFEKFFEELVCQLAENSRTEKSLDVKFTARVFFSLQNHKNQKIVSSSFFT